MRTLNPEDMLRAVVRRRWIVLIPFAIGVAAAPILARYAPARYRSETVIMVVPQRVPDNYVKPTVTEKVEERLPSITRSDSEPLATRTHHPGDGPVQGRARAAGDGGCRRADALGCESRRGRRRTADSFRVSYVSEQRRDRAQSHRAAGVALHRTEPDGSQQPGGEHQPVSRDAAGGSQAPADRTGKEARRVPAAASGQMPTQMQANLQAIQNANLQLQALNDSTNRAQERRLLIERQIADTQAVPLPAVAARVAHGRRAAANEHGPATRAFACAPGRRSAALHARSPRSRESATDDR